MCNKLYKKQKRLEHLNYFNVVPLARAKVLSVLYALCTTYTAAVCSDSRKYYCFMLNTIKNYNPQKVFQFPKGGEKARKEKHVTCA